MPDYRLLFIIAISMLFVFTLPVASQPLDVPVMEHADGGDYDTCSLGQVAGLKAGGDGFLAVRTGPGSDYTMIDKVYNGDKVWIFDQVGGWLGVVYGVDFVECSPIQKDRPVAKQGKKGWVHKNWVREIAG